MFVKSLLLYCNRLFHVQGQFENNIPFSEPKWKNRMSKVLFEMLSKGQREQSERRRRTKRSEQREEQRKQSEQTHLDGGAGNAASVQLVRLLQHLFHVVAPRGWKIGFLFFRFHIHTAQLRSS